MEQKDLPMKQGLFYYFDMLCVHHTLNEIANQECRVILVFHLTVSSQDL